MLLQLPNTLAPLHETWNGSQNTDDHSEAKCHHQDERRRAVQLKWPEIHIYRRRILQCEDNRKDCEEKRQDQGKAHGELSLDRFSDDSII